MVLALDHADYYFHSRSDLQKIKALMKSIAFFDFDGTITTKDTYLEFIKFSKGNLRFLTGFMLHSPMLVGYVLKLVPNQVMKEKMFRYYFENMPLAEFQALCDAFATEGGAGPHPAESNGRVEKTAAIRHYGCDCVGFVRQLDSGLGPSQRHATDSYKTGSARRKAYRPHRRQELPRRRKSAPHRRGFFAAGLRHRTCLRRYQRRQAHAGAGYPCALQTVPELQVEGKLYLSVGALLTGTGTVSINSGGLLFIRRQGVFSGKHYRTNIRCVAHQRNCNRAKHVNQQWHHQLVPE
jgi:hypothetical protein